MASQLQSSQQSPDLLHDLPALGGGGGQLRLLAVEQQAGQQLAGQLQADLSSPDLQSCRGRQERLLGGERVKLGLEVVLRLAGPGDRDGDLEGEMFAPLCTGDHEQHQLGLAVEVATVAETTRSHQS